MDRKNATILIFIRFVTDYGKDNSYYNVKSKIVAFSVCPCVDPSQPIKDGS